MISSANCVCFKITCFKLPTDAMYSLHYKVRDKVNFYTLIAYSINDVRFYVFIKYNTKEISINLELTSLVFTRDVNIIFR